VIKETRQTADSLYHITYPQRVVEEGIHSPKMFPCNKPIGQELWECCEEWLFSYGESGACCTLSKWASSC
jgi:hypothetical protein